MKKQTQTKLRLARDTVKNLSDDKLAKVAGMSNAQPCTYTGISGCYVCFTRGY